jgi:hypothetical protein
MDCKHCGQPLEARRHQAARFCLKCSDRPRIAAPDRKREGTYLGKRINGALVCLDCESPVRGAPGARPPLRCSPCITVRRKWLHERSGPAATAVAREIREGRLPRPSTLVCVDCGRPAEQYDHRDYTKPLQVEPVCRSCNVIRGPAPYPPLPSRTQAAA